MRKKVYTIWELITPDESSIIPNNQKWLCGNKTIVKMERGEYIHNDLLYQNLAKKYKRDFKIDASLDKTIRDICSLFKVYLEGKKTSEVFLESKIHKLQSTNLLVYKELGDLFNECFHFLIKKKDFDINMFKHYDLYQPYLSEEVKYVFNYTLALYHYHYHCDLNYLKEIKHFEDYQLINSGNKIIEDYNNLTVHNEWLQAAIFADLGLIYTLKSQYQLAYDYFQKAAMIHSCVIAKYLPAYYQCIILTNSSPSRFFQTLNNLPEHFEKDKKFYHLLFEKELKLKNIIRKKTLLEFKDVEENIYKWFYFKFILLILKKKLH